MWAYATRKRSASTPKRPMVMSTTTAGGLVSGAAGKTGGNMSDTKTIKLIRGCVVNGEPHKLGALVEVSAADARHLITVGSAEEADPKKDKPAGK